MRQILTACLLCLFVLQAALPAAAAEDSKAWDSDSLLTPGIFSIDGAYLGDGMNAPYEAGYAPDTEGGTLRVILPLAASAPIDGDVIYCGLDLGVRENSPFQYQNYQSIPVRPRQPDLSQPDYDPSLYVARFVLPLSADRRNGVYPLGVTIRFRSDGREYEQYFTIDFTVTDAAAEPPNTADPDPGYNDPGYSDPGYSDPGYSDPGHADPGISDGSGSGGSSGAASAPAEPKVILESAVAAPNPALAGEPFTVTCTLRNTSKKQRVSNMTVSYKSQTTDLIPIGGSSTQYIEEIKADSTIQFAFQMESRLDAQSGPQKIDLALGYDGADGATYTATDEITVQIQQSVRLEYDQPQFPSAVYLGDSINATLNLFNKGKGTLYNVTVSLDVPGIEPESSAFIGNMESGSSKSADIYANVTGLESAEDGMGAELPAAVPEVDGKSAKSGAEIDEEAEAELEDAGMMELGSPGTGETSGEFLVTYEDEFGTAGELRVPVTTDIMQMDFYDEPIMEPEPAEDEPGFPWWGWALIGGGGAAAVGVPLARRRRKKRAAALAAELDDNEIL